MVIHWFRRDLRLDDNTALNAAFRSGEDVLPVYILSNWKKNHHWCGAPRQALLCENIRELATEISRRGGNLCICQGDAVDALKQLVKDTGATGIFFNRDPDPFGRVIDEKVSAMATQLNIRATGFQDHVIHEEQEIRTTTGGPFRVFTPYARAWLSKSKPSPENATGRFAAKRGLPLPTLETWQLTPAIKDLPTPGSRGAQARLSGFLDGNIQVYQQHRDLPAVHGTSRLSQDLRFGTISIREVLRSSQEVLRKTRSAPQRESISTFIKELIWREFSFQILVSRPDVLEHEFQEDTRDLRWRAHWRPEQNAWDQDSRAASDFQRWQIGETGFPIVDAGMRQLAATGFMHNRMRMITAMFLAKDLHIWWMHGESHFMRLLLDGEIASNNNGWQWSASTGTDAAPYFRVQNPWTQTRRFDPKGEFIKKWIPELRDLHPAEFFEPPRPGMRIAPGYPMPMVDHNEERQRAIAMFK